MNSATFVDSSDDTPSSYKHRLGKVHRASVRSVCGRVAAIFALVIHPM